MSAKVHITTRRPLSDPRVQRNYWAKVNKNGPIVPGMTSACWEWTAALTQSGYANFGQSKMAHQIAYILLVGQVPQGLELDHLCRNTRCVNPAHLEAVTHRVNMLRSNAPAAARSRQTHCHRGHEFTAQNTYVQRNGTRSCRTCHRYFHYGRNGAGMPT